MVRLYKSNKWLYKILLVTDQILYMKIINKLL